MLDQAPDGNTISLFIMGNIEMHIGVIAAHEINQLRGINARHMIMRLKRHSGHFAQVVHALTVLAAGEGHKISFWRGKGL